MSSKRTDSLPGTWMINLEINDSILVVKLEITAFSYPKHVNFA